MILAGQYFQHVVVQDHVLAGEGGAQQDEATVGNEQVAGAVEHAIRHQLRRQRHPYERSSSDLVGEHWQPEHGADDANEEAGADEAEFFLGSAEQVEFVDPIVEVFWVALNCPVLVVRQSGLANLFDVTVLPRELIARLVVLHPRLISFLQALVVRRHLRQKGHTLHQRLNSQDARDEGNDRQDLEERAARRILQDSSIILPAVLLLSQLPTIVDCSLQGCLKVNGFEL